MRLPLVRLVLTLSALAPPAAWAQTVVGGGENIRVEYAQVLSVEPVYQVLRATSMVQRCEPSSPVEARRGLSRVVGAVKDVLSPGKVEIEGVELPQDCHMVPVQREFRRPIAYDVDYVHRGVKYRSRLAFDPGNRLRVRVSVVPVQPTDAVP